MIKKNIHKYLTYTLVLFLIASTFSGTFSHIGEGKDVPVDKLTADDGWGYTYDDTNYTWWHPVGTEDVATGIGNDNWTEPIGLGFDFRFYGVDYDSVYINSNGWISFTDVAGYQEGWLPKDKGFNNLIAPYSDGLNITTGEIYYNQSEDNFAVTWKEVDWQENLLTFQVILNETGEIWFNYKEMTTSPEAFVGIENQNSTIGVTYDGSNLQNGLSILFYYEAPFYRVNASPYVSADVGLEGDVLWLEKRIYNLGSEEDTYNLSVENGFWNAAIFNFTLEEIDNITLGAGESEDILIRLGVDSSAPGIGHLKIESSEVMHTSLFTAYHNKPILLVDSDGLLNSESYYIDALESNGIQYNYWNHWDLGTPRADILSKHRVVIWFTGNKYSDYGTPPEGDPEENPTLSGKDRAIISNYLDLGGRIFLSGINLLVESYWGKEGHADSWNSRYLSSVHSGVYTADPIYLDSVLNDPISDGLDINVYTGEYNDIELWEETNYITPTPPGVKFYEDVNGFPAVRADQGNFRTVLTTFEFSGVNGADNRSILMERIINWLSPEIPLQPSAPMPANGEETGFKKDIELSILVEHELPVPMDVYFYDNSTDGLIGVAHNVSSGNRATVTWTGYFEDEEEYSWYVIVRDKLHNENFSETWLFLTNYIPSVSIVSPMNKGEVTRYNVTLEVEVYDEDGDTLNVTFYNAADNSEIENQTDVPSGGTASIEWTNHSFSWGTPYSWYAIVDDGKANAESKRWSFITKIPELTPTFPQLGEIVRTKDSVTLTVDIFDKDGDTLDVKFYNAADNTEIGTETDVPFDGSASTDWTNLSWETTYEWYVKIFDDDIEYTSSTWYFRTNLAPMSPGHPSPYQNEMGLNESVTLSVKVIDQDGDTMDVTFYNAEDDSILGTETDVASGDHASVEWSGLSLETTYQWYAIADDGLLNTSSVIWSFSTNMRPDAPHSPRPETESIGISTNASLSVVAEDPDGDTMTVTFYDAEDDSEIGTVTDVSSGSQVSVSWDGLDTETIYQWYAIAHDGTLESDPSTTWEFTTGVDNFAPETPSEPRPANGTDDVRLNPSLSVSVSDADGDTMTVTFYNAEDDSEIGNVTDIESGRRASVTWSDLDMETAYQWYAVADDGVSTTESPTWQFTTGTGNDAPDAPANPSPEDDAAGIRTSPTLSVDVSDPDGDTLTVTFYDGEGVVIGTTTAVSGTTASVTWSDLDTETTYRWYAIADDGMETTRSETWEFITRGPNTPPEKPTSAEPADDSEIEGTSSTISVVVSDPDEDTLTVTFYNAEDDSVIGTTTAPSGSRASVTWSGLEEGANYEWYAVVDDSEDTERSDTYGFSTEASDDEVPGASNMGLWLAGIALIVVLLLIVLVMLKKKGAGAGSEEPVENFEDDMEFEEEEELFEEEDLEEDYEFEEEEIEENI